VPAETKAPAVTEIPKVGNAHVDHTAEEGFGLVQKGLFFAVILGCVALYIRASTKKEKRFMEKSMV
jgi:hypothetical protein